MNAALNLEQYENNPMWILSYPDDTIASGFDMIHFMDYDELVGHVEVYEVQYYCVEEI